MPVAWLGQQTGSWLAKPFSQWTDIITSPHLTKKKRSRERRAAEGGEAADTHGANRRETALTICASCLRHAG